MINIDSASQLNAVHRQVEKLPAADGAGERVRVLLRRSYDAPIGDVWDAVTRPDRMKRWFMPISGELRVGGSFQLEGNAGGEILTCEPPRLLRVTFGGPTSILEVRLTPQGDSETVLELEHTVPIEMAQSGAGALYVGPGWDGALMGLGLFLRGEAVGDPVAAANSPEAQEFSKQSVDAWAAVVKDSGTATAEQLAAATEVSLAQFAPTRPPHKTSKPAADRAEEHDARDVQPRRTSRSPAGELGQPVRQATLVHPAPPAGGRVLAGAGQRRRRAWSIAASRLGLLPLGRPPTTTALTPTGAGLSHAAVDAGQAGEVVVDAHGS